MADNNLHPVGGPAFSSVRKARAALKERANQILDSYLLLAKQAAAQGDFETSEKVLRFLMEHMPEEEGERIVDISIDKPKDSGPKQLGPAINIGVQIGGLNKAKELPAVEVITIEAVDAD